MSATRTRSRKLRSGRRLARFALRNISARPTKHAAPPDLGRRHGHTISTGRRNPSGRPSESARCDLFDFVYTLRRGVEPNTDVAIALSKSCRQVLYLHSGRPGRLQGLDDPLLQWSARRSPFCFGRCGPGHALSSLSFRPTGLGRRRDFGSRCGAHPALLPAARSAILYGCGLSTGEPVQVSQETVDPFSDRNGQFKVFDR